LLVVLRIAPGQEDTATVADQWSMGYWTFRGNPSAAIADIDWSALTHIVQWAAIVGPNGTIDISTMDITANAPALIAAAHSNGVKVLLGLAQPGERDFQLSINGYRETLLANIMGV